MQTEHINPRFVDLDSWSTSDMVQAMYDGQLAACAAVKSALPAINGAVDDAVSVLKRGGRFFCMEFSRSDWPGFSELYDAWSKNVIPRLGKAIADDEASYKYLVESIQRFPRPEKFRAMVSEAGFTRAAAEPMLGGLVTIHTGWKI